MSFLFYFLFYLKILFSIQAHNLDVWLSCPELESLSRIFGSEGIDFLCEAILNKGIIENARKWLSLSQKLKTSKTSKEGASSSSNSSAEAIDIVQCHLEILNLSTRYQEIHDYLNLN